MHAVYWIPALVVIPVVGLKLARAVHSVKWERHVLAMILLSVGSFVLYILFYYVIKGAVLT